MTDTPSTASPSTDAVLAVNGTTLFTQTRGAGRPLLLVHGGGEDASMLASQAESLAAAGFTVAVYDRRGTGRSGREDWPGGGARQHADDAAALLGARGQERAIVVGVSSGAVIALALAAHHPELVEHVVAWEPPAAGVLPGGAEVASQLMAPVEAHLRERPGDWVGAQAILLTAILGFPVTSDDPELAAARDNAEPMVRDEPAITLEPFTAADLARQPVTLAVGTRPNDVVAGAVATLAELAGTDPVVVEADHEVYRVEPDVLTSVVTTAANPGVRHLPRPPSPVP